MRTTFPVLLGLISVVTAMQSASARVGDDDQGVGSIEVNSKQIYISGQGYHRSFPCNGRPAIVEGTGHVITLTGTCASLEVTGMGNKVTAELVPGAALVVAGSGQTIRWRSRGEAKQDLSGINNKVVRDPLPK